MFGALVLALAVILLKMVRDARSQLLPMPAVTRTVAAGAPTVANETPESVEPALAAVAAAPAVMAPAVDSAAAAAGASVAPGPLPLAWPSEEPGLDQYGLPEFMPAPRRP